MAKIGLMKIIQYTKQQKTGIVEFKKIKERL